MKPNVFIALLSVVVTCSLVQLVAQTTTLKESAAAPVEGLKAFNPLIGEWKGVGQLKRGSRTGAWTETVVCEWSFEKQQASITLTANKGKQFQRLKLTWDSTTKELVLNQTLAETHRTYRGSMPKQWPGRAELVSKADEDGITYRCTIQQLSDIRTTLLFEKQTSATGSFRRIAGVGYTRAGERLAQAGGNQRKCIVTGGLGTIPVSYKGKTYYVCCQGCVQAFNDAPDEIVADYLASLKTK